MSIYFIGDIHGCLKELKIALDFVKFNTSKDTLFLVGDLTYRGPNSLQVLQFLYKMRKNVKIVLGNHDLRLLFECTEMQIKNDIVYNNESWIVDFLQSPNFGEIFNWIRNQPVLRIIKKEKIILVHAGIHPEWSISKILRFAKKIERLLKDEKNFFSFIRDIYKQSILQTFWNKNLKEKNKIQFILNVFTQIRYCFLDGSLATKFKDYPKEHLYDRKPWFSLLKNIENSYKIIFGHWSSLNGYKKIPKNIYNLDSGCCWGGGLSILDLENNKIHVIPSFKRKLF